MCSWWQRNRITLLGASQNIFAQEVVYEVEVALFCDGVVMIAIWQLLPDNLFRLTEAEQLLHVGGAKDNISRVQ